MFRFACCALLMALPLLAWPEAPVRVAVAANFAGPMRQLVADYQSWHTGAEVAVSVGSTGKLYAQIRQGAPLDLFLAADAARPRQLEQQRRIVAGSRRTYALGVLALWSREPGLALGAALLNGGELTPLALANARTAPYGAAAEAVLATLALPESVTLVRGENVGQTFQFIQSGAARAGFVALSQVREAGGSLWLPPAESYPPIRQQAVLLDDRPAARAFYDFLFSDAARQRIEAAGYRLETP